MKLKKIATVFLSFLFAVMIPSGMARAQEPGVSARAAIVMCADNGKVLFAKNEKETLSMASTTKIMTAMLTLEAAQADDKEVSITHEMVAVEGSSMGLMPGDVVTLETLAKGMLLSSGNDAANAAAIALAGSQQDFAAMMNEKAAQIGMKDTHFVTPSGLDDDNHYTTAYDMAVLGAYAMEAPGFQEIASQRSLQVDFINPAKRVTLSNHNRLLSMYEGCIGVKTGFTKKSGRCLVSCAQRNGVRLIAVTLNAPDDWNDHQNMLNYGFSQVKSVTFDDTATAISLALAGGISQEVTVTGNAPVKATVGAEDVDRIQKVVELPQFEYAPVRKGQLVGKIRYLLDGTEIASSDLVVQQDVEAIPHVPGFWERVGEFFHNLFHWS
ncbi:MAG: D-alanyl-D-alanine carboxypeptidase [Clostridiales bacterium]|jgi:D-alanyl-D-alanine carboxypeptidase (penicillin-binding protein 5/6)|nr:D-alanyl-D-alanine carboxypeptidase [Clostridiales bacterium]